MHEEIWKDVVGYEGYYQVSNLGNVRSLIMWDGQKYRERLSPYKLKQSHTTTGYKKVELSKEGIRKSKKVHRLVAKSFITRIEGKEIINHIDGNPLNNHVSNLEWCNQSENMKHAYDTGLIPRKINKEMQKEIIKDYFNGKKLRDIEEKYNIKRVSVYRILKNNNKSPQGNEIRNNKYNINEHIIVEMLNKGHRNVDIAKHFDCPSQLIATYKYNLKKEGKI